MDPPGSGHVSAANDSDMSDDLIDEERLNMVFRDQRLFRRLLKCREQGAQRLLDSFQWLLDSPDITVSFRRLLLVATQRLSKKTDLYPMCFTLKNVTQQSQDPVCAGGFADIYKGIFEGQAVCLKVIRVYQEKEVKHVTKQFSKEAILWGQLSHPNVLPIYGLFRFRQNRPCLVSPFMEHGDINKYLKQNPGAPRVQLVDDVAQGLSYLHKNDIIHGDLKGPNILINDAGRACVADFGISSVSDAEILAWTTQSSASSKGGSVRWQAPELFDMINDQVIRNSTSSDVYAWACVCYEVFTGHVPYANIPLEPTVIFQVKAGARPLRPSADSVSWQSWALTTRIWSLMEDCWKENPSQRPSIEATIERLSPELGHDVRPRMAGSFLAPAQFRRRMGEPIDVITSSQFNDLLLNLEFATPNESLSPTSITSQPTQPSGFPEVPTLSPPVIGSHVKGKASSRLPFNVSAFFMSPTQISQFDEPQPVPKSMLPPLAPSDLSTRWNVPSLPVQPQSTLELWQPQYHTYNASSSSLPLQLRPNYIGGEEHTSVRQPMLNQLTRGAATQFSEHIYHAQQRSVASGSVSRSSRATLAMREGAGPRDEPGFLAPHSSLPRDEPYGGQTYHNAVWQRMFGRMMHEEPGDEIEETNIARPSRRRRRRRSRRIIQNGTSDSDFLSTSTSSTSSSSAPPCTPSPLPTSSILGIIPERICRPAHLVESPWRRSVVVEEEDNKEMEVVQEISKSSDLNAPSQHTTASTVNPLIDPNQLSTKTTPPTTPRKIEVRDEDEDQILYLTDLYEYDD